MAEKHKDIFHLKKVNLAQFASIAA